MMKKEITKFYCELYSIKPEDLVPSEKHFINRIVHFISRQKKKGKK